MVVTVWTNLGAVVSPARVPPGTLTLVLAEQSGPLD